MSKLNDVDRITPHPRPPRAGEGVAQGSPRPLGERISGRTERSESGWRTDRAAGSNAPQAILREREGNSRHRVRERGCKSRAAFTLAEVLITLGIIGIVAAMTIPNLMSKYIEKEYPVRLTKVYSELLDGFRRMVDDYGTIDTYGNTPEERTQKLMELLPQYVKIEPAKGEKTRQLKSRADSTVPFIPPIMRMQNGAEISVWASHNNVCIQNTAMTEKGIDEYGNEGTSLYYGFYQHGCGRLFVDLNGKFLPNTSDIDVFTFEIATDGIVPAGSSKEDIWTNTFENQCLHKNYYKNNINYGMCAAWVIQNKNMDYLHCTDLSWTGAHGCSKSK